MLARAQARVRRHGWANVCLVRADAGTCDLAGLLGASPVDAALVTCALPVIAGGLAAWHSALAATRPGGRVAVDLALPAGGWGGTGAGGGAGVPSRRRGPGRGAVAVGGPRHPRCRAAETARRPHPGCCRHSAGAG
jgi:hypothetical protein